MQFIRVYSVRETSARVRGEGMGTLIPAPSGFGDVMQRGCVKSVRESLPAVSLRSYEHMYLILSPEMS